MPPLQWSQQIMKQKQRIHRLSSSDRTFEWQMCGTSSLNWITIHLFVFWSSQKILICTKYLGRQSSNLVIISTGPSKFQYQSYVTPYQIIKCPPPHSRKPSHFFESEKYFFIGRATCMQWAQKSCKCSLIVKSSHLMPVTYPKRATEGEGARRIFF